MGITTHATVTLNSIHLIESTATTTAEPGIAAAGIAAAQRDGCLEFGSSVDKSTEGNIRFMVAARLILASLLLAGGLATTPRIAQAQAGACQWMFSSGGAGNFQNLAVGPPLAGLRFGDFDGDGKTDVFAVTPKSGGAHQWMFSSGGAGNFQNLAVGPPLDVLEFGDFDGDRRMDGFSVSCN
jgi:hypothetical protein